MAVRGGRLVDKVSSFLANMREGWKGNVDKERRLWLMWRLGAQRGHDTDLGLVLWHAEALDQVLDLERES